MNLRLTRGGSAGFCFRALIFTAIMAFAAQTAFAASADITVSKDPGDGAMFSMVQAAVNAARPGQVIEILDAEVYAEQVTIDSTKSGITIRSKNPTSLTKPIIKYRDTQNTSPKNSTEAQVPGDGPGTSGNFETCAAVRVKYAKNVTLDGIIVDGVSPFVFGANAVWGSKNALFHGNAAITLVVAGGTQIRNCELRNSYFGVYIKDRNSGGVFANANSSDNDVTIPLSGFGKAGNHLFEYNRVHDNAIGFFFESSWDLGSTVRYNLIYNNYYTTTTKSAITALSLSGESNEPGAFVFKDSYLSPVAIYNNTFNNNSANLIGHWQVGGQHLIFNNIFGSSSGTSTGNGHDFMMIEHKFPNRMKNSVFSVVDKQRLQVQSFSGFLCADNPNNPYTPGNSFIADAVVTTGFAPLTRTSVTLNSCISGTPSGTISESMVLPGALIPGAAGTGGTFPTDANIRWLEMAGGTFTSGTTAASTSITLPQLFQSIDTATSNFLEPKWDDPLVVNFIKNQGWPEVGIRNNDGTIADLGAIPSTSSKRQTVTARIRPTNVVTVSGTNATVSFSLNVDGGELNNPKIKYLKWIYQIPDNSENGSTSASFGNSFTVVPANAVRSITPPSTVLKSNGNNVLPVTIPSAVSTAADTYGFFELTVEGTDKNGNPVTSDVGFLPYRKLDYSLKIEVLKDGKAVTEVAADEPVTLRVTPTKSDGTAVTYALNKVDFWLSSNASQMWSDENTPFTSAANITGPTTYPVIFKNTGNSTGNEIIMAAGTYVSGASTLAFFGSTELKVSDRYTLRYRADEGGSIAIGDTLQVVEKGGRGTMVVALADDGYEFTMWSDGVTNFMRTDSNVTVSKTVTAYFCGADNIKTLTYKAGAGGAISGPASQKVCGGSSGYPVTAVPNEGYKFVEWDDGNKESGRTDNGVFEDTEFSAKFAVKTYTLVYAAGQNGSLIGGDTLMMVAHGSNGGMVMALADDGYEFTAWSDGVKDNPRTDKNVTANIAVMAVFDTLKHNVSYYVNSKNGVLVGSATQRVSHGANASAVYVTGAEGYTFFEWSDGVKDSIRIDKNVQANISVFAKFKDAKGNVSVASHDREIPKSGGDETQSAFVPVVVTASGELTVGPNPVGKQSGGVSLFWRGNRVKSASLSVYDASGNFVKKIGISDKASTPLSHRASAQAVTERSRSVGSWDLTDKKGRSVSEGTYLIKGTVKTSNGKKEKISLIVGVK